MASWQVVNIEFRYEPP